MAQRTLWRPLATTLMLGGAVAAAGCGEDPVGGLATIAPAVSTAALPPTRDAMAVSTSVAATTSAAATTPGPEPAPPTTLALADGPWQVVASIPKVTEPGLYYELSLPKLYAYFPTKVSTDDRVFWTMNEADRPIIEAYLRAQLTINEASSSRPMDFTIAGWGLYFADGGSEMQQLLQPRNDAKMILDLGPGYIMRPWIIDDDRTETTATVVDCQYIGAVLRAPNGSLAGGSTEGWGYYGLSISMEMRDDAWTVRHVYEWGDACTAFGPLQS
jgi:hypothetical protein